MKETRNILGWLGMAEEHSVIQDAGKHVEETCTTVAYFAEAVKAFINDDLSGKTVAIENVKQSERDADRIRAKMVGELSEGALLPLHREDLMRFVKAVDKIADWTNSASRLLGYIDQKLPDNILKNISISTELMVGAVGQLKLAIHALGEKDFRKALEFCGEVERFEHSADDQKRVLIDAIIHAKLDPAMMLICYNLAESMEGITDRVESAADEVKLLAVKSR